MLVKTSARLFRLCCWVVLLVALSTKIFDCTKTKIEYEQLQNDYFALEAQSQEYKEVLDEIFGKDIEEKKSLKVTITAYTATLAECDKTPHLTANGSLALVGMVAISRDLEKLIPLNSYIYIPEYGVYKVTDRMNSRWNKKIDILAGNKKAAKLFGKQEKEIFYF